MALQINAMDDNGLLEGRWEEPFPKNTTKPWEWTGSAEILEKFWQRKKTVKYGQCWVFAGVTTSCEWFLSRLSAAESRDGLVEWWTCRLGAPSDPRPPSDPGPPLT